MPTAPLRPEELRRTTPLRGIELHDEIGSTNTRALELASDPRLATPYLVATEQQTAGRGRGTNRWWSSEGALLFSLIVDVPTAEIAAARRPRIALLAGLAVCEAIEPLARGHEVRVKWPNDVYVDGRKVCGILVEANASRAVIGIGINVNNATGEAPAEIRARAIALIDVAAGPLDRTEVLAEVLRRVCTDVARLEEDANDLAERWAPRCFLTGQLIQVDSAGQTAIGRCRGIDEEGGLLLDTEAGPTRVIAGVITLLE